MRTTKARKRKRAATVACTDLLGAIQRLRSRVGIPAYPYVELYGDGSGRLFVSGVEWLEFQGLEDGVRKIDAELNKALDRRPTN